MGRAGGSPGAGLGPVHCCTGGKRQVETRLFGNVRVGLDQPADAAAAQPGGEAIDQFGQLGFGELAALQPQLRLIKRSG